MNTRWSLLHGGMFHIIEWLLHLTPKDMRFTTFLLRDTLANANNFEEAKVGSLKAYHYFKCSTASADHNTRHGAMLLHPGRCQAQ